MTFLQIGRICLSLVMSLAIGLGLAARGEVNVPVDGTWLGPRDLSEKLNSASGSKTTGGTEKKIESKVG